MHPFHEYLLEESRREKFYYDDSIEQMELDGLATYEYPFDDKFGKIINRIIPTEGAPFNFYIWYYKGGCIEYENYFRNLPEAFNNFHNYDETDLYKYELDKELLIWKRSEFKNKTVSINSVAKDLAALFSFEFRKVMEIYKERWSKWGDKNKFYHVFQDDFEYFKRNVNCDGAKFSLLHTKITEQSRLEIDKFTALFNSEMLKLIGDYPIVRKVAENIILHSAKITVEEKKILEPAKRKDRISMLKISTTQADRLYNLKMTDEKPNKSFLNIEKSNSAVDLQRCLSNPESITNEQFHLNCSNFIGAYVFNWFEENLDFTNASESIARMNIFYSSRNNVFTAETLRNARHELKAKFKNYDTTIRQIVKDKRVTNINYSSELRDILSYLHYELSDIFLSK